MKVINLIEMNDWEIKKFLKVVATIQLAVWCTIGLDAIGFQIPILREFICFMYLTFVPGILMLRILKLHKLGNIETLLYTVGLSIATLMFIGFFMNIFYPFFGISAPISTTPLIITISVVVLVLCVISYVSDKEFSDPSFIDVGIVLSPPALFLCLIPFLSVIGTYLMNSYHNNILLMLLIIIIALIALLIGFDKFIPKNLYPLAVFIIAISLLYHKSLISMYLAGSDIHIEHYLCNLVMWGSQWDPTIPMACNGMLSIVMLAPIYSIITNMNVTWVFKIIYPLLFSLVPLGLYRVFQKQTNDKIGFLSCFFFISTAPFYGLLLEAARQQIAELFFILVILLIVDENMDKMKRSSLLIVFGISMVVSHYGLAYLFMFALITVLVILVLMGHPVAQRLRESFYTKISKYKSGKLVDNLIFLKMEDRTISSTFVLLFVVFTLTWYMYLAGSATFNTIVHIGDHVIRGISDILNPTEVEALYILTTELSISRVITRYLYLISQFFISVGILTLLFKFSELKFKKEYSMLSLIYFMILLSSIIIPHLSSQMSTYRTYHIALLFLSPFCVIGCITVFRVTSRVIKISWTNKTVKSSLKILSIFFIIYLLFTTGLVCEVIQDEPPQSISLNSTVKHPLQFNDGEVRGAQWLMKVGKNKLGVYVDNFGRFLMYNFIQDMNRVRVFNNETERISPKSYVFLASLNVRDDEIEVLTWRTGGGILYGHPKLSDSTMYDAVIIHANKIYENGNAQVYH